jgi:hypothetical protein
VLAKYRRMYTSTTRESSTSPIPSVVPWTPNENSPSKIISTATRMGYESHDLTSRFLTCYLVFCQHCAHSLSSQKRTPITCIFSSSNKHPFLRRLNGSGWYALVSANVHFKQWPSRVSCRPEGLRKTPQLFPARVLLFHKASFGLDPYQLVNSGHSGISLS